MNNLYKMVIVLITAILSGQIVFAENIRNPAVAGRFYPEDPVHLSNSVRYYLDSAKAGWGEKPLAIIAPHAGYVFSGQICADAFNQAAGHDFDLIVLLGTNHTASGFSNISVFAGDGFRTPLGVARVEKSVADALIAQSDIASDIRYVHTREHSIEVLLPFVQTLFPEAGIVSVVVGTSDPLLCERFAKDLVKVLKSFRDKNPLIVVSSDLSHYPSYEDARKVDHAVLESICSMNIQKLQETIHQQMNQGIRQLDTCMCGQAPAMVAMSVAKELGAACGRLISYANSGDSPVGSTDRVVGYGAVAFFKNDDFENTASEFSLSMEEIQNLEYAELNHGHQQTLLTLARYTIEQYLNSRTVPLPRNFDPILHTRQGAFVTLKKKDALRGCIGHMDQNLPLFQVVSAMALQAAFNDRRFRPVTLDEFYELDIEISVLTPFNQIESYQDIVLGKDGIILEKDGRKAVFLPHVAEEQGWELARTLDELCLKAGLPSECWKSGAVFHTFRALSFSEKDVE